MSNGNKMTSDLEFEEMIKEFTPSERFLARQVRDIQILCAHRATCYPSVQFSRKQIAVGLGGLSGYTVVIVAIAEALARIFGN